MAPASGWRILIGTEDITLITLLGRSIYWEKVRKAGNFCFNLTNILIFPNNTPLINNLLWFDFGPLILETSLHQTA